MWQCAALQTWQRMCPRGWSCVAVAVTVSVWERITDTQRCQPQGGGCWVNCESQLECSEVNSRPADYLCGSVLSAAKTHRGVLCSYPGGPRWNTHNVLTKPMLCPDFDCTVMHSVWPALCRISVVDGFDSLLHISVAPYSLISCQWSLLIAYD